ncbi:hypothetical protein CONPUDRAFT_159504 [Coniophora puteana RWD-64-598 SS2]|uniref:Uncharacterized protein n=1 Tax=Coniophora puteana (strain RWD-64-598) TaxID=741705 RepID=A0A5M3M8K8_CONPW|nr:uncharacterized protein CONPUDRAFT_159504 [Coniophora puteana RWD-64-598 SS2]EIW75383.1 hypothetical protein CONPUDRAFT_159504 [Coniophora puteana RWD-64-598 SS2]
MPPSTSSDKLPQYYPRFNTPTGCPRTPTEITQVAMIADFRIRAALSQCWDHNYFPPEDWDEETRDAVYIVSRFYSPQTNTTLPWFDVVSQDGARKPWENGFELTREWLDEHPSEWEEFWPGLEIGGNKWWKEAEFEEEAKLQAGLSERGDLNVRARSVARIESPPSAHVASSSSPPPHIPNHPSVWPSEFFLQTPGAGPSSGPGHGYDAVAEDDANTTTNPRQNENRGDGRRTEGEEVEENDFNLDDLQMDYPPSRESWRRLCSAVGFLLQNEASRPREGH